MMHIEKMKNDTQKERWHYWEKPGVFFPKWCSIVIFISGPMSCQNLEHPFRINGGDFNNSMRRVIRLTLEEPDPQSLHYHYLLLPCISITLTQTS